MNTLSKLRQQAGYSLAGLAREADCDMRTLRGIERGVSSPRVSSLNSLARTLGPKLGRAPGDVLIELSGINEPPASTPTGATK